MRQEQLGMYLDILHTRDKVFGLGLVVDGANADLCGEIQQIRYRFRITEGGNIRVIKNREGKELYVSTGSLEQVMPLDSVRGFKLGSEAEEIRQILLAPFSSKRMDIDQEVMDYRPFDFENPVGFCVVNRRLIRQAREDIFR